MTMKSQVKRLIAIRASLLKLRADMEEKEQQARKLSAELQELSRGLSDQYSGLAVQLDQATVGIIPSGRSQMYVDVPWVSFSQIRLPVALFANAE